MTFRTETIVIPQDGDTNYRIPVVLDGASFIIELELNALAGGGSGRWFMRLFDANGDPVQGCNPTKLVRDRWPLWRVTAENRPAGEILVQSQTEDAPTQYTLGVETDLIYIPKESVDEYRASV